MALIRCPECGQEVSDKAKACPKCAYPLAEIATRGRIRVKVNPIYGKQRVSIFAGGRTLWEGYTGEIAEFRVERATSVQIKYHFGMYNGASCEGVIDPEKSSKYSISGVQGFWKMQCVLQAVDMIDSE